MAHKLLHFANLRLGTTFAALGIHGREQRAQLLDTLSSLADLAVAEQVQVVLISGDLFDCPVPAPTTIKAVQAFFTRLDQSGITCVILPGSRDPEGIFDPERQPDREVIAPGTLILGSGQPMVRLEALRLVVRMAPKPAAQSEGASPTALPLAEAGMTSIALTYRSPGSPSGLPALDRALAGFAYVGVGGETRFLVHQEGRTTICSPGVPEPLEWGQERGAVALVWIEDDGTARVESRRTGSRSFARRELEVDAESGGALQQKIAALAHADLGLEVVLIGTCSAPMLIDPAGLEATLAPMFFHVRVVDRTRLELSTDGAAALPQGTMIGNFARVMDGRIQDAADEEQAAFDREAYQLGLSLLQGGRTGA